MPKFEFNDATWIIEKVEDHSLDFDGPLTAIRREDVPSSLIYLAFSPDRWGNLGSLAEAIDTPLRREIQVAGETWIFEPTGTFTEDHGRDPCAVIAFWPEGSEGTPMKAPLPAPYRLGQVGDGTLEGIVQSRSRRVTVRVADSVGADAWARIRGRIEALADVEGTAGSAEGHEVVAVVESYHLEEAIQVLEKMLRREGIKASVTWSEWPDT